MEISAISNIVLSILSFFLAVLSIVLVIITLRQNNKILEETNRPYITIFFDSITTNNRINYFVIKNFGNSAGHILEFKYSDELKTALQGHNLHNEQFDCAEGITLAPGQSKLFPYNVAPLTQPVEFTIRYSSNFGRKEYSEFVIIDTKKLNHIPVERPKAPESEKIFQKNLVSAIHDLIEKQI